MHFPYDPPAEYDIVRNASEQATDLSLSAEILIDEEARSEFAVVAKKAYAWCPQCWTWSAYPSRRILHFRARALPDRPPYPPGELFYPGSRPRQYLIFRSFHLRIGTLHAASDLIRPRHATPGRPHTLGLPAGHCRAHAGHAIAVLSVVLGASPVGAELRDSGARRNGPALLAIFLAYGLSQAFDEPDLGWEYSWQWPPEGSANRAASPDRMPPG